ncbi:MAG: rod shape-determining protein RodA [Fusobacteriales bacterium]|nr:MAG: rod shape-determining protein RodA [Fusobacteriales bacterium]
MDTKNLGVKQNNESKKEVSEQNIYKKLNDLNKAKKKEDEKKLVGKRQNSVIIIFLILLAVGFFNFYSTISHYSSTSINRKILKFSIILLVSMFFGSIAYYIYPLLKKRSFRAFLFFGGIFTFLVVAFFPNSNIFPTINGGKGWIRLGGFSLQVTEIFKIIYIILYAGILSRGKDDNENFGIGKNLFTMILYAGIFFSLLLCLNDLGTGIHYLAITLFLIFVSDIKAIYIWISSTLILISGSFLLYFYYFFKTGYRHHRVKIYLEGLLHNNYDRLDAFQIYQSLIGIGTGGLFGKGYGNGIQKYNYIPEVETDFAIATFAEELGFVGMLLLLSTFLILFILIMNIAEKSTSYFGKYLVAGIGGYFISQVIINIGVAIGLLPVFGIPLPFISSGGSSLLTLSIAMALVLRVNKETLKD